MKTYQEAFRSAFEDDLWPIIVEFGKQLTQYSESHEVLMFMARKAACFAEALRLLKMCSFKCTVTSQRVLDYDVSWLAGKSIAIIDDAVVTGTTVYRTKRKLEQLGCNVSVYVLCVNTDWWLPAKLIKPDSPCLELDDARSAALCAEIVDAISLVPIPYATDFPIFTNLKLTADDMEKILSSGKWVVSDVSSIKQRNQGVFSYVFEPTLRTCYQITKSIGTEFKGHCLVKVRLYGRKYSDEKYWCTFLPIFVMEPLRKKQVDVLFDSLTRNVVTEVNSWFHSHEATEPKTEEEIINGQYKAKLRLIQFVSAERLASYWMNSWQDIGVFSVSECRLSASSISYLFPPVIIENFTNICNRGERLFLDCDIFQEIVELPHGIQNNIEEPTGNMIDGWSIYNRLESPFLHLFTEYEIPARSIVKEHGQKVFEDTALFEQYSELLDRLERGYSLYEIRHWLDVSLYDSVPKAKVVSDFLDKAIDKGIVVPTTCVIEDVVCRAYRHGEDVKFAQEEKKLIGQLFHGFSKGAQRREMSGKEVEKCVVIAIKKGKDNDIFTPADKNRLGSREVISVRYSLHGAIAATGSNKMWGRNNGCSIRDILCGEHYLIEKWSGKEGEERKYIITEKVDKESSDIVGLRPKAPESMRNLGRLIGLLRSSTISKGNKPALTERELILLATVMSPEDLTSALAAEIDWAVNSFEYYRGQYMNHDFSNLSSMDALQVYNNMRNVGQDLLFAPLSSGIWKYVSYKQRLAWTTISRIKQQLQSKSGLLYQMLADEWNILWGDIQKAITNPDDKDILAPIVALQVDWLLGMMMQHLYLQTAFLYVACSSSNTEAIKNKMKSHLDDIKKKTAQWQDLGFNVGGDLNDVLRHVQDDSLDPDSMRLSILDRMASRLELGGDILKRVELAVSGYGEIYELLNYESILVIEWDCADADKEGIGIRIEQMANEVINSFHKAKSNTRRHIRIVPKDYHCYENIFMVAGYRFIEMEYLSRLAARLTIAFSPWIKVRCSLLFDFQEPQCLFSRKSTTEFSAGLFWGMLSSILSTVRKQSFRSQLVTISLKRRIGECDLSPIVVRDIKATFNTKTEVINIPTVSGVPDMKGDIFEAHSILDEFNYEVGVDIGIVTAVTDELRAVHDHMIGNPGYRRHECKGKKTGRDFYIGSIPARKGYHSVACIKCLDKGEAEASNALRDLCQEYNPRLIVFVGIGGGIAEELTLCDVFVATAVVDYDTRADTPEGIKRNYLPLPPIPRWLKQIQERLEKEIGEEIHLPAFGDSVDSTFRVGVGPIGSGKAVVRDKNSEIRDWLMMVSRKMQGVGNEDTGIATSYDIMQIQPNSRLRGYMIIRGVSDGADEFKDKNYRYVPVRNAMIYLESLLKHSSKGFAEEIVR